MSSVDAATHTALQGAGIGRDKVEEYATAFRLFDRDNKGLITVEDLRFLLDEQFGEPGAAPAVSLCAPRAVQRRAAAPVAAAEPCLPPPARRRRLLLSQARRTRRATTSTCSASSAAATATSR